MCFLETRDNLEKEIAILKLRLENKELLNSIIDLDFIKVEEDLVEEIEASLEIDLLEEVEEKYLEYLDKDSYIEDSRVRIIEEDYYKIEVDGDNFYLTKEVNFNYYSNIVIESSIEEALIEKKKELAFFYIALSNKIEVDYNSSYIYSKEEVLRDTYLTLEDNIERANRAIDKRYSKYITIAINKDNIEDIIKEDFFYTAIDKEYYYLSKEIKNL